MPKSSGAASIAAIILAAGRGRRFQAGPENSKVLAELFGKPMVRHVAEAALASRANPVFVITGQAAAKVEAALEGLALTFIRNADPDAGLSQSLALGLAALPTGTAGAIILLADMPYVSAAVIDQLIAAFEDQSFEPHAVVPIHGGRRGNPVLLGRSIFAAAAAVKGDRGARALFEVPGVCVIECPIEDQAVMIDIDTQEALAQFKQDEA